MKRIKREYGNCKSTKTITLSIEIVSEHPEYYLDKIQVELCSKMKVFISEPSIYRALVDKLGYSLQVRYETAAQQNEYQRAMYRAALESLVTNVNQIVFVHETHKDKRKRILVV